MGEASGNCDKTPFCQSDLTHKELVIDSQLTGLDELDTIIHEINHAADWSKKEEWVLQLSTDIARILWRAGYRKVAAEAGSMRATE